MPDRLTLHAQQAVMYDLSATMLLASSEGFFNFVHFRLTFIFSDNFTSKRVKILYGLVQNFSFSALQRPPLSFHSSVHDELEPII